MTLSLGQVVALESAARSDANKRLGDLHKATQREQLFRGMSRTYTPFEEADDDRHQLPAEVQHVQLKAEDVIGQFFAELVPAADLALTRDLANMRAAGDVMIDGAPLLSDMPATWLLHMEKVLTDVRTFIAKLPVLDPADTWYPEQGTGLQRTNETFTVRTEKKAVPLQLAPPTKEHPAQVTVVQEDRPSGRWTTVKRSGAVSAERKRELERRVAELQAAFKVAREAANRQDAPDTRAAHAIVRYILGS